MFSVSRIVGSVAVVGFTAVVAMPPAQAAGLVGYTDPLCTAFYTDPLSPPPAQVLKCAKLVCGISTNISYLQQPNTAIQMTVSCTNQPPGITFKWVKSPQSPAACPAPPVPADTTNAITVSSPVAQTCWYEAVVTDTAVPPNTGWARYGLKWQ
jgi:hypothetical protein